MSLSDFLERNLFRAPFRGLPTAVFLFVGCAFLVKTLMDAPLHLTDPDDYMRLLQTMNWLQGQGWYDLTQPRLSPGAGTIVHWARILDLPIAALMVPLIGWVGMQGAALAASMVAPMLPLALLLLVLPKMVRPLVGRRRANLALLFVLAAPFMLFKFGAGRVDHHNWSLLIGALGLTGLQYVLLYRRGWRMGAVAAIGFAFGLWIGIEILPVLALTIACMAVGAAWRGGFALRNGAIFGLALAVATAAVLPMALPMRDWRQLDISWFSTAYVLLTGLGAMALGAVWGIGRFLVNRGPRLAGMIGAGMVAMGLFVAMVPDALRGPFADYESYNASTALAVIDEAMPFWRKFVLDSQPPFGWAMAVARGINNLLIPCVAIALCGFFAARTQSRARLLWLINATILLCLVAVGLVGQTRVLWFAHTLQFAPLAYVTWRWWDRYAERWTLWVRYCTIMACFLLLGLLPVTVVPYAFQRIAVLGDEAKTLPSDTPKPSLRRMAEFMAQRHDRPMTIMAGMDEGPEILFFTPHSVIGANFNVSGNTDVVAFFMSQDDAAALDILRRWRVNAVVVADTMDTSPFYKLKDTDKTALPESLVYRLTHDQIPPWLERVEVSPPNGYRLYEVHLPTADFDKDE